MRTTNYLLIVWLFLVALGVLLLWYAKNANETQRPRAETPAQEDTQNLPAKETRAPLDPPQAPVPPPPPEVKARPRIVDDAGAPVPGAVVALVKHTKEERVTVFGVYVQRTVEVAAWRAAVGKDGCFDWPRDTAPGTYLLTVRAPEFAPYIKEVQYPQTETELERIRLGKGGVIAVSTGLKDRGVPLILAASKGDVVVKETDAHGEARFAGLAPDRYAVLVGDPGMPFTMRAGDMPQREPYRYPCEVTTTSSEVPVNLATTLKDLTHVSGRVKGCAEGEITIRAKGETPLGRTHAIGADGTFSFSYLPAGEYELVLVPSLGKSLAKAVKLGAGDKLTIDEIDFPLVELRGAVLQGDAQTPFPEVGVALAPVDGAGELSAATDKDGKFGFTRLAPGNYRLTATRKDAAPLVTQVLAGTTGAPAEITIVYP